QVTVACIFIFFFFFSSRRRHTRLQGDWSSDVCSSDLERRCASAPGAAAAARSHRLGRREARALAARGTPLAAREPLARASRAARRLVRVARRTAGGGRTRLGPIRLSARQRSAEP